MCDIGIDLEKDMKEIIGDKYNDMILVEVPETEIALENMIVKYTDGELLAHMLITRHTKKDKFNEFKSLMSRVSEKLVNRVGRAFYVDYAPVQNKDNIVEMLKQAKLFNYEVLYSTDPETKYSAYPLALYQGDYTTDSNVAGYREIVPSFIYTAALTDMLITHGINVPVEDTLVKKARRALLTKIKKINKRDAKAVATTIKELLKPMNEGRVTVDTMLDIISLNKLARLTICDERVNDIAD